MCCLQCLVLILIKKNGLIDSDDKSVLSDVQQRITRNFECSNKLLEQSGCFPFLHANVQCIPIHIIIKTKRDKQFSR